MKNKKASAWIWVIILIVLIIIGSLILYFVLKGNGTVNFPVGNSLPQPPALPE